VRSNWLSQRGFLQRAQLFDARGRQGDQRCELCGRERALLAAGLHFNKLPACGHDHIHVRCGILVFDVIEIEDGQACDNTNADGGKGCLDRGVRGVLEEPALAQFPNGEFQRDVGACDGRGARATIGGEDIAIDTECARPERFEIHGSANAAPDQALDFRATAIDAALGDVARFTVQRRVGQHRVFRRNPAAGDLLLLHPARDIFLHGDGADDLRTPATGENGPGRVGRNAGLESDGTKLIGLAAVASVQGFRKHGKKDKEHKEHTNGNENCGRFPLRSNFTRPPDWERIALTGDPVGSGNPTRPVWNGNC
jgi:hypothetical protein